MYLELAVAPRSDCSRAPLVRPGPLEVTYRKLDGNRREKFAQLARGIPTPLQPQAPLYHLAPRHAEHEEEFYRGIPLTSMFDQHGSVPVTARDWLVVDTQRDRLVERIRRFRDRSLDDDDLRNEFRVRTRSRRYPPGDSRSWRMSEARRECALDEQWESRIIPCCYRPFDTRWIFWADYMIDWPRTRLTVTFPSGDNVALIARPCQNPVEFEPYYVWTATHIPIDGIIRSDNLGNETMFPLWLNPGKRTSNLCELPGRQSAFAWFCYIVGLLSSGIYRRRFAASLSIDFPRVFFTTDRELESRIISCGSKLIDTQRNPPDKGGTKVAAEGIKGKLEYRDGCVMMGKRVVACDVPEELWQFRIGFAPG